MPSVDNLEFVMESLALGHTVLDQKTVSSCCCRVHPSGPCLHCSRRSHADACVYVCAGALALVTPAASIMPGPMFATAWWQLVMHFHEFCPASLPPPRHVTAAVVILPSPLQAHEYLLMVIDTISKDEVDALAKSLLSYLSHYNQEQQVGRLHLLAKHWPKTLEKHAECSVFSSFCLFFLLSFLPG